MSGISRLTSPASQQTMFLSRCPRNDSGASVIPAWLSPLIAAVDRQLEYHECVSSETHHVHAPARHNGTRMEPHFSRIVCES